MKKLFILLALSLSASIMAAEATPEKIEACKAANFKDSSLIKDCVENSASVEKVSACSEVGYTEDYYLNQCINLNRATPAKIKTCVEAGFTDQNNLNDCLAINAELFKISACSSLGLQEKDILICIRRI